MIKCGFCFRGKSICVFCFTCAENQFSYSRSQRICTMCDYVSMWPNESREIIIREIRHQPWYWFRWKKSSVFNSICALIQWPLATGHWVNIEWYLVFVFCSTSSSLEIIDARMRKLLRPPDDYYYHHVIIYRNRIDIAAICEWSQRCELYSISTFDDLCYVWPKPPHNGHKVNSRIRFWTFRRFGIFASFHFPFVGVNVL